MVRVGMDEHVELQCGECGSRVTRKTAANVLAEKQNRPVRCRTCVSAANFRSMHAARTPEERSAHGKKARARVTHSKEAVAKQWVTVKSDPEKYAAAKARLSRTALNYWANLTDEQREAHYRKVFANKTGKSKAGDAFLAALTGAGVTLATEQMIHGYLVDGLDAEAKVVVEFYGDVFHCNPRVFNNPERYCSWISRTVGQQWARDRKRLAVLYRYGYRVVIVWESDWYGNRNIEIERVKDALCKSRGDSG